MGVTLQPFYSSVSPVTYVCLLHFSWYFLAGSQEQGWCGYFLERAHS